MERFPSGCPGNIKASAKLRTMLYAFLAAALTSCAAMPPAPVESPEAASSVPPASPAAPGDTADTAVSAGSEAKVCYQFADRIPEPQREMFRDATEELLTMLPLSDGGTHTFDVWANVQRDPDPDDPQTYPFTTRDMKTWKQVMTMLRFREEEYARYGFLYAKADAIAGALGWECDLPSREYHDKELASVFENNPALLNLVFPCFSEPFTKEDEAEAVKALSIRLFRAASEKKGDFMRVEEADFLEEIVRYAKEQQIPWEPIYLQFALCSDASLLKIRTRYIEYQLPFGTYRDPMVESGLIDDWMASAAALFRVMEQIDDELSALRQRLGLPVEPEMLAEASFARYDAHFLNRDGTPAVWGNAKALFDEYRIKDAGYLYAMSHEYAHLLSGELSRTDDEAFEAFCLNVWRKEGFAVYYAPSVEVWQTSHSYPRNPDALEAFEALTGKTVQTEEDWRMYLDIAVVVQSIRFGMKPGRLLDDWLLTELNATEKQIQYLSGFSNDSYDVYASFVFHLSGQYGEDTMRELVLYPGREEELTGKTLEELISGWEESLRRDARYAPLWNRDGSYQVTYYGDI